MNARFTLLLARMAALLMAASLPAFGQLYQPVVADRPTDAQVSALIPDFSGIWARLSFPGFEPPLEGPGPVTNRLHAPNGGPNLYGLVGDYTNPILKPNAGEIVKRNAALGFVSGHIANDFRGVGS